VFKYILILDQYINNYFYELKNNFVDFFILEKIISLEKKTKFNCVLNIILIFYIWS